MYTKCMYKIKDVKKSLSDNPQKACAQGESKAIYFPAFIPIQNSGKWITMVFVGSRSC